MSCMLSTALQVHECAVWFLLLFLMEMVAQIWTFVTVPASDVMLKTVGMGKRLED